MSDANNSICYDGKCFVSVANTANGEVSSKTIFRYHQSGDTVWADYAGGEIEQGFIIGSITEDGKLHFNYIHKNLHDELRCGTCISTPEILADGRIKLYEEWQWLNGDLSKGTSEIVQTDAP